MRMCGAVAAHPAAAACVLRKHIGFARREVLAWTKFRRWSVLPTCGWARSTSQAGHTYRPMTASSGFTSLLFSATWRQI
eukprot:361217-Chlamydomonas_euryale.AAC.3